MARRASHPSDLVAKLPERKVVWLMVPSGAPVDENIEALMPSLKEAAERYCIN